MSETRGLFVTGTGTGVGKTVISCALARAGRARGLDIAAIKPFETGCDPDAEDAVALADACGRPELATDAALYRVRPPVSPYAATRSGEPAPILDELLARVRELAGASIAIVEGAGGLLVPLDATRTTRDFIRPLGLPLIVVARDGLGVLSHVLTALESAQGLDVRAVVLSRFGAVDPSQAHNRAILAERLDAPVHTFENRAGEAERLWVALGLP